MDDINVFDGMGKNLRKGHYEFFIKSLANAITVANSMGNQALVWNKSKIYSDVIEALRCEGISVSIREQGGYDIDWSEALGADY